VRPKGINTGDTRLQMRLDLRGELCARFCPYYKPGRKEDLRCNGFLVIEGLIKKGFQISFFITEKGFDPAIQESLLHSLCAVCPFFEDGCDFVRQKERSSPCGGFILLAYLLGTNIITIDNIRDVR
jgi:hypothetical protein